MKRPSILLLLLTLLLGGEARAQMPKVDTIVARYGIQTAFFPSEKLFLHIDRTAYHVGETIWFNGYLSNAGRASSLAESNFIYVELLRSDGSVEERVKIKRDGKGFPGHIDIDEDMPAGEYTLRAYTQWQMNFPDDYMFHQRLLVFGGAGRKERTNSSKAEALDVSFYPEGGRYFAGQPARIGFKAMDGLGRSVELEASVVDAAGEELMKVSTRHDGMGVIQFIPEDAGALWLVTSGGRRFALPPVSSEGASVSVQAASGRRMVRIVGNGAGRCNLLLRDISSLRFVAEVVVDGTAKTVIIPEDAVSPGINSLILIDEKGRMLSERLFFRYDASAPAVQLKETVTSAGPRTPVTASIELKDPSGAPLDGVCSVSVLRLSLAGAAQDDGISSYMHLTSELRGAINDPRWYFDASVPEKERAAALDMLMMIQGWSYYDMDVITDSRSPLGKVRFAREHMQYVRGKISRPLSTRAPKKFSMLVLIPRLGASRYVAVEEGRSFVMDSLDLEEGTGIMIKVKRDDSTLDYIPSWDGDEFAAERRYKAAPGYAAVSRLPQAVEFDSSADTLEAAVLVADAMDTELGVNGRVLPKSDYREFGHWRILEYLRMKAPYFEYRDGIMRNIRTQALDGYGIRWEDTSWDESPVKLVVDGAVEPWEGFESLTVGETKSIAISTQPDIIYNAREGVVSIHLEYGTRVTRMADNVPSMLYFTPLGWQSPQKFYAPRYDRGDAQMGADRRNTIHWDPSVRIADGRAEFTFCTADDEDYPYVVDVEGVTASGEPFSVCCSLSK